MLRASRLLIIAVCLSFTACHHTLTPTQGPVSAEEARALLADYRSEPFQAWQEPPSLSDLPAGPTGIQIRYGIELLTHSSRLTGPRANEPTHRFASSNFACVNCHQAGPSGLPGTKPDVLPFINTVHEYPKFDTKSMRIITLEERIIGMYNHGPIEPNQNTPEVAAIAAYIEWLGQDVPKPGARMSHTRLAHVDFPNRAADPVEGKKQYMVTCAPCHGPQGLGIPNSDLANGGGYAVPAIAGDDSFDDGGHMYMVPVLARFIYSAMPPGATSSTPTLSAAQAYDIAAFVDSELPRRHAPSRVHAYPNPEFRAAGFAIPEICPNPAEFQRAKFGPFRANAD